MNAYVHQQQLLQARQLLQNNQFADAKHVLQVLANQNYSPALVDLATILLIDTQDEASATEALNLLIRAEHQHDVAAIYLLSCISLCAKTDALDWQQLAKRMQQCISQNNPYALCDAAVFLAHFGSDQEQFDSTQLLELSALQGNITAMALLGERLANGFCCIENPARANSIRQLALDMQLPVPEPNPAFGFSVAEPQQPPKPLEHLPMIDWRKALEFNQGVQIDERANVVLYANFFSAEECLYVRCMGAPMLQPSVSVDSNGKQHQNQIRTSAECIFNIEHEQLYLRLLQIRMANAADLPLAHAEPLILLRYLPSQEYKPHRDYLPPNYFVPVSQGGAGQRLRTVIAYLNTPEQGGDTLFPLLQQIIPATQGQLLHFDNMHGNRQLNTLSLHSGAPVVRGVKWICTLWMRQNTYRTL